MTGIDTPRPPTTAARLKTNVLTIFHRENHPQRMLMLLTSPSSQMAKYRVLDSAAAANGIHRARASHAKDAV